jgi:RNA polymerase sigma factor (sigma-70 family)
MSMDDPRTDEALMLAYRDGDAAAFEALYGRWRGRLYRYLAHQARDNADELFQEVWMKVVGARGHYEVAAKFSTWLFRIAHNRLMDHFRVPEPGHRGPGFHDPEVDPADDLPAPEADSPPALLERRETARRILDCLSALPALQREAFLMAEEGGHEPGGNRQCVRRGAGNRQEPPALRSGPAAPLPGRIERNGKLR